jgi:hypothetical protein
VAVVVGVPRYESPLIPLVVAAADVEAGYEGLAVSVTVLLGVGVGMAMVSVT